jgi:hypothetical protein
MLMTMPGAVAVDRTTTMTRDRRGSRMSGDAMSSWPVSEPRAGGAAGSVAVGATAPPSNAGSASAASASKAERRRVA